MLGIVAAACGGNAGQLASDDDAVQGVPEPSDGDNSAERIVTEEEDDDGTDGASTADEDQPFDISVVEDSVVKIASEGTFVDSQIGLQLNSAGVGSGFIISDDGLVVTNNHVVTGAALLRVFLAGASEPVNAQILGVSECSDLAVIQLESAGHPALQFRDAPVTTGLSVFAAGFPASDAYSIEDVDYTLTSGIVSNLTADGETSWASVDEVIEHDARIRGGNSGGPLVDEHGRVVGINYAGIDASDQNYAIAAADARVIIDRLATGEDVDSIGINGQAVTDPATGISGIWVASVESGSPADQAGIEPGDIITSLENLVLSTDGTMSDYCDILRTQGAASTMDVEVLRYSTGEVLEGQINGDPLAPSFSFAQEFDEEVVGSGDGTTSLDTYADYVTVSDDSGLIFVDIPTEWYDVDGTFNEAFGPSIWASPDLMGFLDTWSTPGIKVEATTSRTAADIDLTLDEIDWTGVCVDSGREPYEDPLYIGTLQLWTDCGGPGGATYIVLAASPFDGSFLIRVEIQAIEPRDLDAADVALATFYADMY